jgi:hypothetical protein
MLRVMKVVALAFLLQMAATAASFGQDLYYGGFDGAWEGTLKYIDPSAYDSLRGYNIPDGVGLRIVISGNNASVFYKNEDGWSEVKPGLFHIVAHKTNAIVYAIESSRDVMDETGQGGWVETWNFTITHKDRSSLYVFFNRAVNNYLLASDFKDPVTGVPGRLFGSAFGELASTP